MSSPKKFVVRLAALLSLTLLAAGCDDGDSGLTLSDEYPVIYVDRALPRDVAGALDPDDLRDPGRFRPGARLLLKQRASPSAPVLDVAGRLFAPGERYDVRDVSPSHDGTRLLFALRGPFLEGADEEDQPTWNIWEYDIAADALRPVMGIPVVAEEGHDLMPVWLADGRILFASTRQRATRAALVDAGKPQFAPQDDSLQNPAYTLHVMEAGGSDIRQITFGSGSDLYPSLLANGRIVFARQARSRGRVATHLYTVRPDGRDLAPAFGIHSHDEVDGDSVEFTQPRAMPDGRVLVLERPYVTDFLGGALAFIDLAFSDEDRRVDLAPGEGGLAGTGFPGETQPAAGGRYADAVPLNDGTGRLLVSWSSCRVEPRRDPLAPPPVAPRLEPCVQHAGDNRWQEAEPIYGVFVYEPASGRRLPVVVPREGRMFDSLAVAVPRPLPAYLPDGESGVDLDAGWIEDGVGVLDIRSVHDVDGGFDALDSLFTTIAELADPASATAGQRPARFLRLEKAVEIPDDDVQDFDRNAFGITAAFGMRELIGYVPVEPDGSVRVQVPANVPFTFSIVDARGQRVGARHDALLQLMPGELRVCAGCHAGASTLPHGRNDSAVPALHVGAAGGMPYPNTLPALVAQNGETMAQLRARLDPDAMQPAPDLLYDDVWTDPLVRAPDASTAVRYDDLTTASPLGDSCGTAWTALCRVVIHYETHIHPLWSVDRGADTCTQCHTARNPVDDSPQVPAGQLDLRDGPSEVPNHLAAFRELLANDRPEQTIDPDTGELVDVQVPDVDEAGNPILVTVLHEPPLVPGSARAGTFFDRFAAGGTHAGRLTEAELRLLGEWVDVGAQYWNDPFLAPLN
ncbi:MAG: hypothetical protein ACOY33_11765 [Pseudomonadota bacterium]